MQETILLDKKGFPLVGNKYLTTMGGKIAVYKIMPQKRSIICAYEGYLHDKFEIPLSEFYTIVGVKL